MPCLQCIGTAAGLIRFAEGAGVAVINRHDAELLDKQLQSLHLPTRHDGLAVFTIIAVFIGGLIVGNLSRTHELAHAAVLEGVPLIMQR